MCHGEQGSQAGEGILVLMKTLSRRMRPLEQIYKKARKHKILQASLQQYVNHELLDVQAGFRKGRGTRDQIANIL